MSYFVNSSDEAETAFYGAFENIDWDLMKATWHQSDETFCIHPGGPILRGYETVIQQWKYILQGSRPTPINYKLISSTKQENLAIHLVEEHIGPESDASLVLATNTYIKSSEGWRMFSHHASLPPPKSVPKQSTVVH